MKFAHKYVISAKDVRRAVEKEAKPKETDDAVTKVLSGFDLQNNQQDRRMLFEVTGMRIFRDEFVDADSSDSEGDEEQEELLPSDFAMMDRFIDEDEDDPAAQTYALNP